ncbi:hypothetical protein BD311DRAFT_767660 [Dichomitus squalens]|uniref:Uncharacterized protein n=1 Tax=Dichomitus squalens TaxID=114155 RepID=A0A4Q9MC27_9APHY|nr:hypothetical protein BD311DRAFT_767660 [Dichomitus squalens]
MVYVMLSIHSIILQQHNPLTPCTRDRNSTAGGSSGIAHKRGRSCLSRVYLRMDGRNSLGSLCTTAVAAQGRPDTIDPEPGLRLSGKARQTIRPPSKGGFAL